MNYLTKPLVKALSRVGVNPNHITATSVVFAAIGAYYIYNGIFDMAVVFMLLSIFIDVLDGGVARYSKRVTKFGNYFDAMIDKYVEVILYVGFALGGYSLGAILALSGSFLLSYAKARLAITIPIDNHDWPAIGERADRLIILIIGMVLFLILPEFSGYSLINITLYTIAGITYIGGIQRILYARDIIDGKN
jgi:phosphatidylglycerophosphate synthase